MNTQQSEQLADHFRRYVSRKEAKQDGRLVACNFSSAPPWPVRNASPCNLWLLSATPAPAAPKCIVANCIARQAGGAAAATVAAAQCLVPLFMLRPSCIVQIILRAAARLRYIKFQFHVHLSRLWRGEAQHVGEGDEASERAVPGAVLGTEVRMSVAELSQGRAARRKLFGQVAWRVNEGGRRRGR